MKELDEIILKNDQLKYSHGSIFRGPLYTRFVSLRSILITRPPLHFTVQTFGGELGILGGLQERSLESMGGFYFKI
jgi:hypothetical protein